MIDIKKDSDLDSNYDIIEWVKGQNFSNKSIKDLNIEISILEIELNKHSSIDKKIIKILRLTMYYIFTNNFRKN